MNSLRRIAILAKRNLCEIVREPLSLVFMLAMPLLMEVLFFYLFHTQTQQFTMAYLAPGIVVFAQAFSALFVGLLLATDRTSTFLTRLYVSKARAYEFIAGYAAALVPVVLVQSVLFFVVGGFIDNSLFGIGMLWGILLSLVTSVLYIGIGILLGSLCNEKAVGGVASIVITGQSILSGMWFPTQGLSPVLLVIMKCLPFKNATLAVQNALLGDFGFAAMGQPVLVVLAYAVAIFALAIVVFHHKMRTN